jgi:predicted peptidase
VSCEFPLPEINQKAKQKVVKSLIRINIQQLFFTLNSLYMSKVLILIALITLTHVSVAQDFVEFEKYVYQSTQDTLPYRLLRPKDLNENKKYPLVLFLHGKGERGSDNIQQLKYITVPFLNEKNRNDFPCFLVVPQCPENETWTYPNWYKEPQEPISSVIKLIDSLSALPFIDNTKIYVVGLSMGGFATWYLITRHPEKFAAAVPICGGDWSQVDKFKYTAIWAFHGARDKVVYPDQSRRMIEALKKVGAKPKYTEYKKAEHDSWTPAFNEPDLFPWLFGKQLAKSP